MDYETEEQQVEAIKKWWVENGRSVILGVAIGAAAIFGWQGWGKYQLKKSEAASDQFTAALDALQDEEDAVKLAETLKSDHSGSVYAVMASLIAARDLVQADDLDAATEQLRWAMDNADQADLKVIAQMRLARVMGAQGNVDDALALLPATVPETYTAAMDEIKGDLLFAKGDVDGAREAYQKALDNSQHGVADRNALSMKLNDLAVAEDAS